MNYIIWKGVNSNTIPGLVIQELPPISKPPMRYSSIEVDGRDGDIVEELGYGSYDKALFIGLTKNADINQIIKYFSGEGEIVFSNESNKYYKAKILEQIDYERLVRFRTANVIFHTQPFKYLANEEPIELESELMTESESNILEATINNIGNIIASPILDISGEGTIGVYLNGSQIFSIDLSDENEIEIDTEKLEAYNPSNHQLKNRKVVGDYENFRLLVGENTIGFSGDFESATITNYTRWL